MNIYLKPLYILIFLIMTTHGFGQNSKSIAGEYRDGVACCMVIFEDNTFCIIAYATFIHGTLKITDKRVDFFVHKPDRFYLYGRKNTDKQKGNNMLFGGFQKGDCYMAYEQNIDATKTMYPIFNTGANCFSLPYVWRNVPQGIHTFYFLTKSIINQYNIEDTCRLYSFENKEGYNDFAVSYSNSQDINDFHLTIVGKNKALQGYYDNGNPKDIQTIEKIPFTEDYQDIKKMMDKQPSVKYVFLNPAFRPYEEEYILDTNLYVPINAEENIYVSKGVYRKDGKYDTGDPEEYHNPLLIYKYTKIEPTILKQENLQFSETPIFTANCN